MSSKGVLLKEFKTFVGRHSERLKSYAKQVAEENGRPYLFVRTPKIRKDDEAREIAERDGVNEGLVCVFSALEPCQSFILAYGKGKPRLKSAQRKCICFYFYLIDHTGARFTSLLNYLVPVWAVSLGALVLGETLPISSWAALLMILGALLLMQRQA